MNRMDTDKTEPVYKAESRKIVGCAMEVLNELEHGFHEKPYENSLVIEFRLRGIPYEQQRQYEILYKQEKVGDYIPDLLAWTDGKLTEATVHAGKNCSGKLRVRYQGGVSVISPQAGESSTTGCLDGDKVWKKEHMKKGNKISPLQKVPVFSPRCPYCESTSVFLDPKERSNLWRKELALAFLFLGSGALSMHMVCGNCDRTFLSRKNESFSKE